MANLSQNMFWHHIHDAVRFGNNMRNGIKCKNFTFSLCWNSWVPIPPIWCSILQIICINRIWYALYVSPKYWKERDYTHMVWACFESRYCWYYCCDWDPDNIKNDLFSRRNFLKLSLTVRWHESAFSVLEELNSLFSDVPDMIVLNSYWRKVWGTKLWKSWDNLTMSEE